MRWFKKKETPGNHRRGRNRSGLLAVNGRGAGKGRDRVHRAGAIVLLLAALSAVAWLAASGMNWAGERLFAQNERFTIRRIDLTSTGTLSAPHLREYAQVTEGQNLFAVDIAQIARNLERTPRVRSASVQRRLPDTLVIRVEERTALARLAEGAVGIPMAVDADGFVLGPGAIRGLPQITGTPESGLAPGSVIRDEKTLHALQVLDLCEQTRLGALLRIQAVNVRPADFLELTLAGGAKVEMARNQFKWRLEKLADLVATQRELGQEIEYADLTVDRNFPVRTRAPAEARLR